MAGIFRKAFKIRVEDNPFLELFYNVLLVTLFIVCLTAIISTKGKTVFILCIPFLYLYFKSQRLNFDSVQENRKMVNWYLWSTIGIVAIITVTLSFFIILKFSIRNDVAFYTKITETLIPQGIENPFHYYNAENPVFKGNVPYHYFEMWFGSLCFQIANLLGINGFSNYLIYIFFVFNLFRVLAIIGIIGLISNYVKVGAVQLIIVFLLLVIDVSAFCNWGNESYVAESNYFERPNFIFYYLFLIPIFHSVLTDNKEFLIIWAVIFIITTVTALPAIAGTVFLYVGYELVKNGLIRKNTIIHLAWLLSFVICFAAFYKLFGVSKEASLVEPMSLSQIIAKTLSIWKACIFMFSMLLFKVSIIILISFLISRRVRVLNGNKQLKKLHYFTLLICFCGIGVFQMIPYLDNMYQFAFIGYCAVILMLMIVIAIKFNELKGAKFYIAFSVYILIIFIGLKRNLFFDHILVVKPQWTESIRTNFLIQNNLSIKYINEIQSETKYMQSHKGVSLIDGKDALGEFLGLRHSMTFQLGNYLMAISNNVHLPLVSDPSTLYPDPDRTSKDYYKAYAFNKKTLFYNSYRTELIYKNNLLNYLTENGISYIIASKHLKPYDYIDSAMINNVIIDENKGHQFIKLSSSE